MEGGNFMPSVQLRYRHHGDLPGKAGRASVPPLEAASSRSGRLKLGYAGRLDLGALASAHICNHLSSNPKENNQGPTPAKFPMI